MEQMSKEKLIEYFIEQLGDNEALGNVMSIDQIRKKLNYIIKDVTYNDEIGCFAGGCEMDLEGRVNINFDLRKISWSEEKVIIVHELLHALSATAKPHIPGVQLQKYGLHLQYLRKIYDEETGKTYSYISRDEETGKTYSYISRNVAINEGMTDTLAEIITGSAQNGYSTEKDIYKILSIVIGKENMLRQYFSETPDEEPLDILKKDLIRKYGEILGNDINNDLKRVLRLSDQLLDLDRNDTIHGINNDGRNLQSKTKEEMYKILEGMIEKVIENEPNIINKINNILIPTFSTSLSEKFSEKIFRELRESKIIGYNEKQNISHIILTKYFELCKKRNVDLISDLCIESGNISQQMWNKKPILKSVLAQVFKNTIGQIVPRSIDYMNKQLDKIKYRQVGDYYMFLCHEEYNEAYAASDGSSNGKMFDKDGISIEETELYSFFSKPINNETFSDKYNDILKEKFKISRDESITILKEQLREKVKEFKVKTLIDKENKEYEDFMLISIARNLLKVEYIPDLDDYDNIYEFYSVDSNGLLQPVELRRRTKIY